MKIQSRFARCAIVATTLFSACGDDSGPSNTDTATDTGTVDTDVVAPEVSDTSVADPDSSSDSSTDTADMTEVDSAEVDSADADTTEPAKTTATVTIDGTSNEVTPSVRRAFVYTQTPVQRQVDTPLNQASQLTCEGTSGHVQGGRIINPTSVGIAGGFGSNCDPGGSGENFRLGEENMLFEVRQACGGRTGTCSYDFTEDFLERFGSCSYNNVLISTQYNCEALFPGPGFVVEVPTSFGLLRAEGLDGLGEMGCEQRVASFRLDGQPVTLAEGTCRTTIDERGPSLLSGRIEATLVLSGTARQVVIDFESNLTETRPGVFVFFQDDLCASNSITTRVETVGGDTFDVFTSGTLACQANPQRTVEAITVSVPRPRTDGQANISFGQAGFPFSTFGSIYPIDVSSNRVRVAAYTVSVCQDEARTNCAPSMPIVYFQGSMTP